ncbi:MAG: AEC family transporter [Pseudomonadota bacterium]
MAPILAVLADPILPVFAIMALGYAMGRFGVTSQEDARRINRFAMMIFLPVLIFGLLAAAPVERFALVPVLAYAAMQGVIFAVGYWAARRFLKRDAAEAVLLAFCGIFANNAFFTLPIAVFLYGPEDVLPITEIVMLDSTVTFAGSIVALQLIADGRASARSVAGAMLRSPVIVAILLGLAVAVSGVDVPMPVATFIAFNGSAAAPMALFSLGIVLSATRFTADPAVLAFSAVKLVVFPGAVALALGLADGALGPVAGVDPRFVLAAAGPSGTMAFSLALLYGVRTETIAQIVIWTSVLSLLSLALLA